MQQLIEHLKEAGLCQIYENEPLAPYTTWKIGGPADLFVIPEDRHQLQAALQLFRRFGVPWKLLGKGSNTLVSDKGVRGAVIKLGSGFEQVRFDGERVYAGAAYSFIKLSVLAGKHGLTGLEFAGGIPGSVGGAVYMNAGAHGSDVSRILLSADVVLEDGELVRLQKEDFQFGYRHSVLQERAGIVVEAVFQLKSGDRKEIAAAMAIYKDRRLKTQPLQLACAGSVFRNPANHHAAQLIEQAGLKGMRVGDAEVSRQHANFIVNTGKATAEDVLALIAQIQRIVQDRYGVQLEPEVLLVGER